MLIDVVVDANVLGHSQNPQAPAFEHAMTFVVALRESTVVLCVDNGFSLQESDNRSIMGREYMDQLHAGSVAFAAIVFLASWGRVEFIGDTVPRADREFIRRTVPRNTRDQHYVRVTCNSEERVLVSHDHADFPYPVRAKLRGRLGVRVLDAAECSELIVAV